METKVTVVLTLLEAQQLDDAAGQMRDDQGDWNRSLIDSPRHAAAATAAYHRACAKLTAAINEVNSYEV